MIQLQERDYTFDELTMDEGVALDNLKDKLVEGYGYICDAIMDSADEYVPTYYSDTWKDAEDIEDHINDAITHGLTDGCKTIAEIINMGYYQRYTSLMYDNLEDVIFNASVELLNDKIEEFTKEELENLEIDEYELESRLEDAINYLDNNSTSSRIAEAVDDLITEIKEELDEYREEHCAECGEELDACVCDVDEDEDEEDLEDEE